MSLAQISSLNSVSGGSLSSSETDAISSNNNASTNSAGALQNEFLQMMVAQIQNQDPLNPLDGTQYVSQLAQFSMVEGVENLRVLQQQNLTKMDTQQVLQSTNLVGREVMAPANSISTDKEQTLHGQINLQQTADAVALKVYDQNGNVVATQSWGATPQGTLSYDLPVLPAGKYSFEVTASQGDSLLQPQNYIASEVERVTLPGTGEVQLAVQGVGNVSLFNVVEFGKASS